LIHATIPSVQIFRGLFLEMLRLLVKHDFNRTTFILEAEPLHEQLLNLQPGDRTCNELILPYDVLWDEIVKRLPDEPWLSD
jgi:hypothetical protein